MEDKIEIGLIIGWVVMFSLVMVIILVSQSYRTKILKSEKEKQIIAFKAAFEAEEKQKERIATNLHDEIIPLLTALGQNVKQHKKEIKERDIAGDFDKDSEILDQSIQAIRAIALDLIPATFLNFGLIKALEQYTKQLNNLETTVELESNLVLEKELPFSKQEQINIYRICLEILNNLKKHSGYSCLRVVIEDKEKQFLSKFIHDGKYISNEEIEVLSQSSSGLGLKSLKSRAMILNASINYSIEANVPTINLSVPYKS